MVCVIISDCFWRNFWPNFAAHVLPQVPIDKNLIDVTLMDPSEIKLLNAYHQEVWENVSPLLQSKPKALAWLKARTSPL
jgi:Xaa-Pro aminopeptidase